MVGQPTTARARRAKEGSPTLEVVPAVLGAGQGGQADSETCVGGVSRGGQDKEEGGYPRLPGPMQERRLRKAEGLQGVPERGWAGRRVLHGPVHGEGQSTGGAAVWVDQAMGRLGGQLSVELI